MLWMLGLALAQDPIEEPLPAPARPAEDPQPAASDPFSDVLRLADGVAASGYPRDATSLVVQQLERHPDHPDAPGVRLRLARVQRGFGLVDEEIATLGRGTELHAGGWNPWFRLATIDAQLQAQNFRGVADAVASEKEWDPEVTDAVHYLGAWGRIGLGDEDGARVLLAKVRGPLQADAESFENLLRIAPPRQRRPGTAGALSVVPGLGQAYAGNALGGLGSLVLTGGSAGAAAYFHQQEQPVLTGLFGTFAGLFWISGMFDAGGAAHRFNEREASVRFELLRMEYWPETALTDEEQAPLSVTVGEEE